MSTNVCIDAWQQLALRNLDEMPRLLRQILGELDELGFTEKECFGMRLAMEEAIVNAFKHGNRSDPTKLVRVRYQASLVQFTIEIEDEGRGFIPDRVPDPLAPQNLDRPGGRGLLLMYHYMSWIQHNDAGNCVTMCKVRDFS